MNLLDTNWFDCDVDELTSVVDMSRNLGYIWHWPFKGVIIKCGWCVKQCYV